MGEEISEEKGGQTEVQVDINDAENPVKTRCQEQREALPGEPLCVVCGHYGEYICDATESDVCSIECKHTILLRIESKSCKLLDAKVCPVGVPAHDECFYVKASGSDSNVCLSNTQLEALRYKIDICVKGVSVPPPILSFHDLELPQKLQMNLEEAGYVIPTPIQMQAMPAALVGRNLLVSAETGSGKTASFLVPLIMRCCKFRFGHYLEKRKPLGIVLSPTRELCSQIEEQAKALAKGLPLKTALVVGGDPLVRQIYRIQQGVELIIATPGRLIDLLSKQDVELDAVGVLVLDEVDCMFQKGFHDQVMQVLHALAQPQLMMFSATIPLNIQKMLGQIPEDLLVISAGEPGRPAGAVKQIVMWVESKNKKQKLFNILTSNQHFNPPVAVFVGSKLGADLLCEAIAITTGLRTVSIHGNKTMDERRECLKLFLTGGASVLVSTGVLGRGVDLLKVRQVIIFDMPDSIQEYVHQIGRASKLGAQGTALVFINEENKHLFMELIDVLKSSGVAIPRELLNSPYSQGFRTVRHKKRKLMP